MKKIICVLGFMCTSMPAFAAHPLVTDDTGVQGTGGHQIEINTDWSHHEGEAARVGALTYTYGLTDTLDLYGNVPMTFRAPDGTGVGDMGFGVKWRVFERDGLSLALKPELLTATGNVDKGLGNGKTSAAFTAIASYETGDWALHGNAGVDLNRYQRDEDAEARRKMVWRASTAAVYALNDHWRLLADTGVAQNVERANRAWPAFALVGAIWSPNQAVDIDIGARFSLNRAEVTRQLGVGLTLHY